MNKGMFASLTLTLMVLLACQGPANPDDSGLHAQVDLGGSLTQHAVKILVNDQVVYENTLGKETPLAGPLATTTLSLPDDTFEMQVIALGPNQIDVMGTIVTEQLSMDGHTDIYVAIDNLDGAVQITWQYEPFIYM